MERRAEVFRSLVAPFAPFVSFVVEFFLGPQAGKGLKTRFTALA